jgi:hypothetical protein
MMGTAQEGMENCLGSHQVSNWAVKPLVVVVGYKIQQRIDKYVI